jgi:hypothetical protein
MKPINSVISGLVSRAQADANSTGPQHGGRGVATVAVLAKLESQSPAETDRNLLAWLESSLNVAAKPQSRMMFPPEGGFYRRTTGFQVSGLTPENRETARQAVQSAMTRPPLDKCEEWVAGRELYLQRFPDSRITFNLGDFTLFRLEFQKGLWVGGFGRAVEIEPEDIAKIATLK